MNNRLEIALSLLSDRGAIFISIDDNEQAELKYFVIVFLWNLIL